VLHGQFIENPKCCVCQTPISHEWLAGDYTMLVCESEKCFQGYLSIQRTKRERVKEEVEKLAASEDACIKLLTEK
jgi:hypothetical protein